MALLTTNDTSRIEAAVASAEARSSGEIVVAVVGSSSGYALRRAITALVLGVGLALGAVHLFPRVWPDVWLLAMIPAWALGYWLFGRGPLLRLVVPPAEADAAARRRARLLFAEQGLHRTREHTGVLLLVSEREHRVVVLGDSGIDAKVQGEGWSSIVADVVRAIRQGKAADGLVTAVERIGGVLAAHFPRHDDDTNELPNTVLDER